MNSKKMGLFAAAALTVMATQASATDAKATKPAAAAKDAKEMVCMNGCGGKGGDKTHGCSGHVLYPEAKTEAACKALPADKAGKWAAKGDYKGPVPAAK